MKGPCEEFADRIIDYVDGELPQDEAQAVTRHLAECECCRQTVKAVERSLGLAQVLWSDNLGGSGKRQLADGSASAMNHRQAPKTPLAAATRTWTFGVCHRKSPAHPMPAKKSRRIGSYAVAASILIAVSTLMFTIPSRRSQPPSTPFAEVERRIVRAGVAAELLAATRIVAQCEGTESIVERQYRYILREYADTAAAESIRAQKGLPLGGIQR